MQVLSASEVFKNIKNVDFEKASNIVIDFSSTENIDLKAIKTLLNLQKLALLNSKTLSIQNVNPDVSKLLDITGLNKTFLNLASNPIKGRKAQ